MILENVDLKPFNTFGISVTAEKMFVIDALDTLKEYSKNIENQSLIILGGGSNILFTKKITLPIFKNNLKGIEIIEKNKEDILIRVAGGENWHEFVLYCVENSFSGIENLSLIPGTVGACPVQNIGAYGVEVKSFIEKVEAWDLYNNIDVYFNNEECEFEYRNSIFKKTFKNRYFIHHITFRLKLNHNPILSYKPVKDIIEKEGINNPSIKEISDLIISIRQSKLPNPTVIGNAGSFFKNPTITMSDYINLKEKFQDIPCYPQNNNQVKIPAAWLIEKAGWKGLKRKTHGVHDLQCLVLVNLGGAKGNEIYQLSQDIIDDVNLKYNILLEREVNII